MMEQDKYTARTLAALQSAQQIAAMRYHQEITSTHVLLALAKEPEGLLATIFDVCGVDLPLLKARLEKELAAIPSVRAVYLSCSIMYPSTIHMIALGFIITVKVKKSNAFFDFLTFIL